jgi:hypothetical protein
MSAVLSYLTADRREIPSEAASPMTRARTTTGPRRQKASIVLDNQGHRFAVSKSVEDFHE